MPTQAGRADGRRLGLDPRRQRDLGDDAGAAARRALDAEPAVERGEAVGEAAQARAACRVGDADAVVGDLDRDRPVRRREPHHDRRGAGVLDDVRDRLGDDVVGRGLDRLRQPLVDGRELDRQRRPRREPLERSAQAAVAEHRRVDAAGELAQLLRAPRRAPRSHSSSSSSAAAGSDVDLRLREPERERERDQPLLRAVVQVALEAPPLLVAGRDDAGARGPQLLLLPLAQR